MRKLKIVFEDNERTKVIVGDVISDTEFLYKIKTLDGSIFEVGKKNIVSTLEIGTRSVN